jgi:hypothetical protein
VAVIAVALLAMVTVNPAGAATTVTATVPGTAAGAGFGGTSAVATGVVLGANTVAVVTATGTVYLAALSVQGGLPNGPNGGNPLGQHPAGPGALVPSSPWGCLIARVGSGTWRCIGAGPTVLTGTGEVFLGVNDGLSDGHGGGGYADNSGAFAVRLAVGTAYPPDVSNPTFRSSQARHGRG